MRRLLPSVAAAGVALLLAVACSDEQPGSLFPDPDAGPLGGVSGTGGSGGTTQTGAAGAGGTAAGNGGNAGGGGAAGAGNAAGSAGQGTDAGVVAQNCSVDDDCSDQNACTLETCQQGNCVATGVAAPGTPCGSTTDDACTDPDACDGSGVCQPNNDPAALGMPCGSSADDACTNPDSCDADGVCQPNDEPAGTPCGSSTDDECTNPDICDEIGQCSANNAPAGTPCGSDTDDECANPDSCGNGVCLSNDADNGSACTGGSCTGGACIDGQPIGCPADVVSGVVASVHWSSVGRSDLFDGGCDSEGTPDYALVFTAPQAGTYRFIATGLVDSTPYTGVGDADGDPGPPDGDAVLTVAQGSCAGPAATQVACNDDDPDSDTLDSRLDIVLADQQVVTVYLNEYTQTGGGTGTLLITLQP